MKSTIILSLEAIILGVAGCATPPVVLAPAGPNPAGRVSAVSTGGLQVFSRVVRQIDDKNQSGDGTPFWYQHTDYDI